MFIGVSATPLYLSVFSRNPRKYGPAPYSVRMRKNVDQNNYEYGHFLRIG